MEETEIEDYFADYFAKLSHTLARCGNEWYSNEQFGKLYETASNFL